MNYSIGSGITRYIRASKIFSKFRAFQSSVCFEVPCTSKFRAFRSSVRFEVPCGNRFRGVAEISRIFDLNYVTITFDTCLLFTKYIIVPAQVDKNASRIS